MNAPRVAIALSTSRARSTSTAFLSSLFKPVDVVCGAQARPRYAPIYMCIERKTRIQRKEDGTCREDELSMVDVRSLLVSEPRARVLRCSQRVYIDIVRAYQFDYLSIYLPICREESGRARFDSISLWLEHGLNRARADDSAPSPSYFCPALRG